MTHKGWTNYETWCVYMHFVNDKKNFDVLCEYVRENDSTGLMNYFIEIMPDLGTTFYADLFQHAVNQVNWEEIINNK